MTSNPGELDLGLAEIVARGISLELWRQRLKDALDVWRKLGDGWRVYQCTSKNIDVAVVIGICGYLARGKYRTNEEDGRKYIHLEDDSTWYCVARKAPAEKRWESKDVTPKDRGTK